MGKEWKSFFAVFFMIATSLSGCLNNDISNDSIVVEEIVIPEGTFVTNSTGIRIHLQEQRIEFLDNVQTTIETNRKN